MRRHTVFSLAATLIAGVVFAAPANAMPLNSAMLAEAPTPAVHLTGSRDRPSTHDKGYRTFGHHHRPRGSVSFGFSFRSGNVYFNGHRGYRQKRSGFVLHRGYYFPGHVIRPRVVHKPRVIRLNNSHVRWCYARYKTYSHHSNTFFIRRGVKAVCRSPYSR